MAPIAEENADVLVLHRSVGHRDRKDGDFRRIAQRGQDWGRDRRGRRDVRPAHVGELHGLAGVRVTRGRAGNSQRHSCGERRHTHPSIDAAPPSLSAPSLTIERRFSNYGSMSLQGDLTRIVRCP